MIGDVWRLGVCSFLDLATCRFEAAYSILDANNPRISDDFSAFLLTDQGVQLCSDALLNIQDFLGRFLVKEFDHEANQKLTHMKPSFRHV